LVVFPPQIKPYLTVLLLSSVLKASPNDRRIYGSLSHFVILVNYPFKVFNCTGYGGRTEVKNNHDPWWKEDFSFFNAYENNPVRLEVYNSDLLFDDLLGACERSIKNGTWQHSCFLKKGGTLYYSYTLEPLL
uniref:C2 domain-containing protein n=1 Tax=Hucho hucho TaxID=62062 RepID=A0A4W5KKF4_9TELE